MNDPTPERDPAPRALTPEQEERLRGVLLNQIHAFSKYYGLGLGAVVDSVSRLSARRFYRAGLTTGDAPAPSSVPAWIGARIAEIQAARQDREIEIGELCEELTLVCMQRAIETGRKPYFGTQRRFDEYERQRALAAPLPDGVARFRPRGDAS